MVCLLDRLYSEEELPNEFKLFVPQAQKTAKKPIGVNLNFSKPTKENVAPIQNGESENQNKSEMPEESIQHEINQEEEHKDEEEEMENQEASVNVA